MLRIVKILSLLVAVSAFKFIWHLLYLQPVKQLLSIGCVFLLVLTIQDHIPHFGVEKLTVRVYPLPVAEENLAQFLQSRAPQLGQ